ncbi:uncharacterized protein LOC129913631 [Episyrphus balteatus]|uniref:uncharacterized protein LOC129913631 n=1 Tax=Episyrphus balteatus TaxID=286459 RepID=UPI00248524FB|nr:uncharacterized protein LOC129913631 [Episyrphus balteatus]
MVSLREKKKPESASTSHHEVKLPRVQIPMFDGRSNTWIEFHDIFNQVIHCNNRLSDVEKMQYLKNNLKGEASKLLRHLEVSNNNYKVSWDLLNERYANKRRLVNSYLHTLLNQPKVDSESSTQLKKLHDTTKECLYGMSNLGFDTSSWEPIIIYHITQRLDIESLRLYEQSLPNTKDVPSLQQVYDFLTNRFESLESLGDKKREHKNHPRQIVRNFVTKVETRCRYCRKTAHSIYKCNEFLALHPNQKLEAVKRQNLCRNCLSHTMNESCQSRRTCSICKGYHHTLLHNDALSKNPRNTTIQTALAEYNKEILLATAMIKVTTYNGKFEILRALIDTGAQASFITEEAAQMLSVPKSKAYVKVSGLGASSAGTSLGKVHIQVQPRFSSTFKINIDAYVLPKLTNKLPNSYFKFSMWKNYLLADQTFNQPGPIDVIIGADVYPSIICDGIKKSENGTLAQNTELGWIISGKIPVSKDPIQIITMISTTELFDLSNQLKRFWEIEETPYQEETTNENDDCEKQFKENHRRNHDGTYTVRIPFKPNKQTLGDSKKRAMARLLQMEKKFKKNNKVGEEYRKFMREYLTLGHMKPIEQITNPDDEVYYMPHQAVIKADSTTTKLRVVFDASSKTDNGESLNDNMLVGPRLQADLATILLRWRKYKYVFTADIEKMYRQIKIDERDMNYQRILWRFSPDETIKEYALTTVTYGTSSAPYLAIKTIRQLADDEAIRFPKASKIVHEDFYMDDVMTGAHTIDEARAIQKELVELMQAGGFNLRKWTSNNQELLRCIPLEQRELGIIELVENEEKTTIKTLGINWNPATDTFHFKVSIKNDSTKLTKRIILSKAAQIFDPLGWITPVTLRAKLIIQKLWKSKVSWDDEVPETIATEWIKYQSEASALEQIKIPRYINYSIQVTSIELHGFCDASEQAYGAVVYSKITTRSGDTNICLLTGKSKVAPIKSKLTIPRLELCGAELLSKLMVHVSKTLEIENLDIFYWTDSMITLGRIQGSNSKLDAFERNRIQKIQRITNQSNWNYVKTGDNPADCASRSINASELINHKLWWYGPSWLKLDKNLWQLKKLEKPAEEKEDPVNLLLANVSSYQENAIITQFSSINQCLRVLSHCRRFIKSCRSKELQTFKKYITVKELKETLYLVLRQIQYTEFKEEIKKLTKNEPIAMKSKLLMLNPIIDDTGLLRVGGRLQNSSLPYEERHPIILPHNGHFTKLIIEDAHMQCLHGGNSQTLAFIRRKYWILSAKNRVRQILNKCVTCCRYKASNTQQIMGNLPEFRVVPSPPFSHTGIDYAGPIQIRMSKGRGMKTYKGYIAVFICCTTKALHLEAVSDLTSQSFIAAYKRFAARRGNCKHIYSDCGSNFIGANKILEKELQDAIKQSSEYMVKKLAEDGIHWHFNPPAAPHMGGLWEAGVKSKNSLDTKPGVDNFCKMKIDIPFESNEKAQIVLDVLKVDSSDPDSEHRAKENIFIEEKTLYAQFTADTPKSLRSCASSFYDKLILITDLMKEFSEKPTSN